MQQPDNQRKRYTGVCLMYPRCKDGVKGVYARCRAPACYTHSEGEWLGGIIIERKHLRCNAPRELPFSRLSVMGTFHYPVGVFSNDRLGLKGNTSSEKTANYTNLTKPRRSIACQLLEATQQNRLRRLWVVGG